jgi:hypothetical protein
MRLPSKEMSKKQRFTRKEEKQIEVTAKIQKIQDAIS